MTPRKMSYPDKKLRMDLIEETLRTRGWTEIICAELQQKTGASRRTLYRDRDQVLERIRQEEIGTRETRRTKFLLALDRDIESARADKKWAAVATMANLRCKILGMDVPPTEPADRDEPQSMAGDLQSLLVEVRKLRKEAQSRGSMVAAANLIEREQAILSDIRAQEDAEKARLQAASSDDEVIRGIEVAIAELPDPLIDRLEAAISRRRAPAIPSMGPIAELMEDES